MAYDPADLPTVIKSATTILRYNVIGLSDAQRGARRRIRIGNRGRLVLRLVERPAAEHVRQALRRRRRRPSPPWAPYETNGDLSIPLVTIHTTADEWRRSPTSCSTCPRSTPTARGLFLPVPIQRYGHCNFTATEIGLAFLFTANLP